MKRVTASSMIGRGTTYHSFGVAFPAVSFNCTLSDNWCNTVSNVTALILYTKTEGRNPSSVNLCGRRESNPYASRHQILSLACLPISTRPHYFKLPFLTERAANIQYFFQVNNIILKIFYANPAVTITFGLPAESISRKRPSRPTEEDPVFPQMKPHGKDVHDHIPQPPRAAMCARTEHVFRILQFSAQALYPT